MGTRVGVIIDWDNMWMCGRDAFLRRDEPRVRSMFCPLKLAQRLAGLNGRGAEAELVCVQAHSGLPMAERDPEKTGVLDLRRQAWARRSEGLVEAKLRPLEYPKRSRRTQCPECETHCPRCTKPRQKGVDLAIGIAAYESIVRDDCDVVVIASHDSDLLPAVEAIVRFELARKKFRMATSGLVETASWVSRTHSQSMPELRDDLKGIEIVNHALDRRVHWAVADRTDFTQLWRDQNPRAAARLRERRAAAAAASAVTVQMTNSEAEAGVG